MSERVEDGSAADLSLTGARPASPLVTTVGLLVSSAVTFLHISRHLYLLSLLLECRGG